MERSRRRTNPTLSDRVDQAYYDYGRFCCAHPIACISISLFSMLVLSYPALSRFRLPVSSPMDVHWSTSIDVEKVVSNPEWLFLSPAVYLQQIVIRGSVEPWNSFNLTSEQAVRGPLSCSFSTREAILSQPGLSTSCLHIRSEDGGLLPDTGCLLLSPSLFWENEETKFAKDQNILDTVFGPECTPSMCIRDMLLGMPTGMTGIKQNYQTNRKRSIDYILTLFLHQYDPEIPKGIRESLSQKFESVHSSASDENTFVHVFYRPRKYFVDYAPLAFSFVVSILYIYYSASKFEMVSSRLGLAIAAAFTVVATLLITVGISVHLDLHPSMWGAEIFPYLTLIVGLENILCITRSVVYTPPSLDVSSRVSHGLSHEGYRLTKYFLLEILFLSVGFVTGVPEIQLFCQFAVIGLVVDFYMQLFFYTPCLIVDLHRLGSEEKRRFSLMLFSTQIPQLRTYPDVGCPIKRIWPGLFERERKRRIKRTLSDSRLDERESTPQERVETKVKTHRRSASSVKSDIVDEIQDRESSFGSARLRLLYFVTRTRFFQRSLMVLFAVWTIWLGVIVHHKWPGASGNLSIGEGFGVSHRLLETAPQEWGEWQRRTFKWWPVLFNEYNLSLSGHYITFLPPIVMKATIPPWDPSLTPLPIDINEEGSGNDTVDGSGPHELKSRIYWLEQQLKFYMGVCAIFVFATVTFFIFYACFWGRWRNGFRREDVVTKVAAPSSPKKNKSVVEAVPLLFAGHRFPVDFVVVCSPTLIISVCQDGRVIAWNANTGEKQTVLNRTRVLPTVPTADDHLHVQDPNGEVSDPRPRASSINTQRSNTEKEADTKPPGVWSMCAVNNVVVLGCSDGSVEIGSMERCKLLAVYIQSKAGVVHVQMRGNKVILARLDGTIEVFSVEFSTTFPLRVHSMHLLSQVRAHHKPISSLVCGPLTFISASHDHTVKLWDTRTGQLQYTLHAHNAPVTCVCVDHHTSMLFTSCEEGVVCWWEMESGELKRSSEDSSGFAVQLAVCDSFLLGLGLNGQLSVWDKGTGQLVTKMAPQETVSESPLLERRFVVTLTNDLAATSHGCTVSFWDLSYKALIKQVDVGGSIDGLLSADPQSVICFSSNNIYRINVPVVRLK